MAKTFKSRVKMDNVFGSTLAEQFADVFGVTGLSHQSRQGSGGRRMDMFANELQPKKRKQRNMTKVIQNLSTKAFTNKRTVGDGVLAVTKRKFNINKEV